MEELAKEQEEAIAKYQSEVEQANKQNYEYFQAQPKEQQAAELLRIEKSPFEMDEAETRVVIDQQLLDAGWEADTENLRYSKGARPEPNKNKAIAEWPTESGPADYVLFIGMTLVAVVEAKKNAKNVYGAIDQAKRYAKGINALPDEVEVAQYGEFKVPLTFATNGRAYLKQLEQESGIWFLDVRETTNRRKALKGWYSPQEIKNLSASNPCKGKRRVRYNGV